MGFVGDDIVLWHWYSCISLFVYGQLVPGAAFHYECPISFYILYMKQMQMDHLQNIWMKLIWSNFMRIHWQKVMLLFHGQSKLSPDPNIYWNCMFFFLLLKFKLLIDNWIKNRPKGVPKNQNNFFTFGHNSWWKRPNILFSKLYMVTKSGIFPQQKLG